MTENHATPPSSDIRPRLDQQDVLRLVEQIVPPQGDPYGLPHEDFAAAYREMFGLVEMATLVKLWRSGQLVVRWNHEQKRLGWSVPEYAPPVMGVPGLTDDCDHGEDAR